MASCEEMEVVFPKPLVQFWMGKAREWTEATAPSAQLDACRHLDKLRVFLQQVLGALELAASAADALQAHPFIGQLLGRLCDVPCITADEASSSLLVQCLKSLFSPAPQSALERRANDWIRKTMCHLVTIEEEEKCCVAKDVGLPSDEYHADSLQKTVSLLSETVERGCKRVRTPSERCHCDDIHSVSLTCVPLVTRPEVAPLIGALVRRPMSCDRAKLSHEFVNAVNTSFLSKELHLDVQCAGALWCHSLSCLEGAVFSLLRSVLAISRATDLRAVDQQVEESLLPQACAQHCSIFLVVNDIFRSILLDLEDNSMLRLLIQSFTRCFLIALAAQDPQERCSLKSFFPLVPTNLLVPLLTLPSEVPQEAWPQHLSLIISQLQQATSQPEDPHHHTSSSSSSSSGGGGCCVFEVWFLLVQGGGWLDVAAQLLASAHTHNNSSSSSSSSTSSSSSLSSSSTALLLWLLAFFYHPTNRGHQRTQQWEHVQRAWGDLRSLCWRPVTTPQPPPPHPPPGAREEATADVLCSSSSSSSKLLLLRLLLNLAIFCPAPCDITVLQLIRKISEQKKNKKKTMAAKEEEWVEKMELEMEREKEEEEKMEEEEEEVEEEESLRWGAECLLAGVALRLSSDTSAGARVQARLRTLEDTLWKAL
ncbi:Fanconi anemia group C protein [Engraulis encrasicolus]|uniref:Fanconi anemia group C protein n=1 Tax=Engraulis encrasicolus TaxID=184585 RepID=UPI002FCFA1FC